MTRGLTVLAKGTVHELLDAQFQKGCLPEDPEQLRVLIQATPAEWRRAWPSVEPLFPASDGRRANPQFDELRATQLRRHKKAVEDGIKGSFKRWHGGRDHE